MFFRPQGFRWGVPPAGGPGFGAGFGWFRLFRWGVPPAGGPGFGAGFGWFRLFRLGAGSAPAVTFTRMPLTGAGR